MSAMLQLAAHPLLLTAHTPAVARLPAGSSLPKLVVFDLDNTLWRPELYQVARRLPAGTQPVAGTDVRLFPAAQAALHELASAAQWRHAGTQVAIASRTKQGAWARALLSEFRMPGDETRRLQQAIAYQEIYPGSKLAHFRSLHARSGVAYADMLFFDDARSGRFGNVEPVARLGVCAAHCPDGLTHEVWCHALAEYVRLRDEGAEMGVVLPPLGAPEIPPR